MLVTPELLKKVRQIEIRTSRLVDDVLAGQYHSAFKGRGIEFEEVRPYQVGDDVRSIDWNVTARYNEPYVKLFREERELTVILMVDVSASQGIGTSGQLKRELVAELGATLAFSAIRNADKVGLISFTNQVEKHLPPRKGSRHVLRVIRELLYSQPVGRGTNIRNALEHLNRTAKRRAVVFLISDFQDVGYENVLRVTARKHDVVPIVIGDPREESLPNVGMVDLLDAETGQHVLIDTSSSAVRRNFTLQAEQRHHHLKHIFGRMKLDNMFLQTGQDFTQSLRRFFRTRRSRFVRHM